RARQTAILRWTGVCLTVTVLCGVALAWQHGAAERESARTSLLDAIVRDTQGLTPRDLQAAERMETLLLKMSGPYQGNLAPTPSFSESNASRHADIFDDVFANPAVYIRGPLEAFKSKSRIAEAARESSKDVFLSCLID